VLSGAIVPLQRGGDATRGAGPARMFDKTFMVSEPPLDESMGCLGGVFHGLILYRGFRPGDGFSIGNHQREVLRLHGFLS